MIPKHEIILVLLALLGVLSFPIALFTGVGEIFLYGYPLGFPLIIYGFKKRFGKGEVR